MRNLKRLIFTLLGITFVTGPVIAMIYALTHAYKYTTTIGAVIAMSVIGILLAFLLCILGVMIDKLFENKRLTIFTAFFRVSFQKRKRLYHSTMGEFELIIDEKNLEGTLVRQGFFSCLTMGEFDLERKDFMDKIKEHLDTRYKEEIKEKEECKRKREFVEVLMKEEGYLDVAGKRDDKISKLGIK
jgi:hypothetical protein